MSIFSTAELRAVREHCQSSAGENEIQRQLAAEEMALQVCNWAHANQYIIKKYYILGHHAI
jgi:hypothetical protein